MKLGHLIIFAICILKPDLIIQGIVLTRYTPCGLGIIHFDKLQGNMWKGVINLEFNQNSNKDVDIEMYFEKPVILYGIFQNISINVQNNNRDYNLFICGEQHDITKKYEFILDIEGQGNNKQDIPLLTTFILNNRTLCDERIMEKLLHDHDILDELNGVVSGSKCGRKSFNNSEVTYIGTDSKAGYWPWYVGIFTKNANTKKYSFQYGGLIISRTAVLSSGIVSNPTEEDKERVKIIAGAINFEDEKEIGKQTLFAEKLIFHPNFARKVASSHLVIYKVNKWKFTEFVQPICVWGPDYEKSTIAGKSAVLLYSDTIQTKALSAMIKIHDTRTTPCFGYSALENNEFTFCGDFGSLKGNNTNEVHFGSNIVVPVVASDLKITWYIRGILTICYVNKLDCNPKKNGLYTDVAANYPWITHNAK